MFISSHLSDSSQNGITKIVEVSNSRPHLVTSHTDFAGRTVITAHTSKNTGSKKDRRELLSELRQSEMPVRFRVRSHSARKMVKAKTLESMLSGYACDKILHDPTGAFSRSMSLVGFASDIRSELGKSIAGVYWNAQWRTLYVVLDHTKFFENEMVKIRDLAAVEQAAWRILGANGGDTVSDYISAIRLSFELPAFELIPIDEKSHFSKNGLVSKLLGFAKIPVFATMLGLGAVGGLASSAAAAEKTDFLAPASEPAVFAPNAKVNLFGGVIDNNITGSDEAAGIAGSITVPLSYSFGAQIDGVGIIEGGESIIGVGGHVFWRDPSQGLLGVTAGFTKFNRDDFLVPDQEAGRFGVEGEMYIDQFTVGAVAGRQFGSNVEKGFYGNLNLGWYATDDLKLTIGAGTNPDVSTLGTASIEFQPAINGFSGLTFFADGVVGSDSFASVLGGIRFYFGQSVTLKDRHRKDDPELNVPLNIVLSGASSKSY